MAEKYIEVNIEILRKQRDENVEGEYRDYAAKTYRYIEKKIKKSVNGYCNPKNLDVSKAVFDNKKDEAKVRGFIKDLKKSEYLSIEGVGSDRQIKILQKLDFYCLVIRDNFVLFEILSPIDKISSDMWKMYQKQYPIYID